MSAKPATDDRRRPKAKHKRVEAVIVSVSASAQRRTKVTPSESRVESDHIDWTPDSAAAAIELLTNPPAPTEKLKKLLAGVRRP